jgi:hypothetical protein
MCRKRQTSRQSSKIVPRIIFGHGERNEKCVCVCVGGGGGGGPHTPKGTDCTRKVKTTRALEIIAVVARFRNVVENNGCKRQDEFRVV